MVTQKERRALEAAKRGSLLQVLMRAARLANERGIARVNAEAGSPVFRPSLAALLPHIALEGTRASELAERLGVTKQAVHPLLTELEALGIIERLPDPSDRRAKLVRFTRSGLESIHHGVAILRALERDLEAEIGAKRMAALRDALPALLAALERMPADEA